MSVNLNCQFSLLDQATAPCCLVNIKNIFYQQIGREKRSWSVWKFFFVFRAYDWWDFPIWLPIKFYGIIDRTVTVLHLMGSPCYWHVFNRLYSFSVLSNYTAKFHSNATNVSQSDAVPREIYIYMNSKKLCFEFTFLLIRSSVRSHCMLNVH